MSGLKKQTTYWPLSWTPASPLSPSTPLPAEGKQRGIKIGEVTYDEIPKTMLMSVVRSEDQEFVIETIMNAARTGSKGAFGDGKIFISPVEDVYTISSGICDTAETSEEATA